MQQLLSIVGELSMEQLVVAAACGVLVGVLRAALAPLADDE